MLIAITPVTFSSVGGVEFDGSLPDSDLGQTTRRVSRTATLDGSCTILDQGFCHGDRTMQIKSSGPLGGETCTRLRDLQQDYSLLHLAVPEGVFQGVMQSLTIGNDAVANITFMVKEMI